MAKKPKDCPEIGDRVQLRGNPAIGGSLPVGTLKNVDTESYWARVKWDAGGPVICHLFELKKVPVLS